MAKLFGTDGVRGVANADLLPEFVLRLARAGTRVIARSSDRTKPIVVGRDTRLSGPMLEAAVVSGIVSAGREALVIGVVPTPGVARIVTSIGAAGGIMISASHNPVEYNGIKFFGADGFKLDDDLEREVEKELDREISLPTHDDIGKITQAGALIDRYTESLLEVGSDLRGLTVVVDGAYGAAVHMVPNILERLGARVVALHDEPDGSRINVGCGATELAPLAIRVRELANEEPHAHVVGVAFDGDADRALFIDERAEVVDGDRILLILARDFAARGSLPDMTVVGTVMSNFGLAQALARDGITLVRAAVGDRYVLDAMRTGGYILGGEQSGHVIDLGRNTTGDGPMVAVAVLSFLARTGARLVDVTRDFVTYPQVLVNVRTEHRDAIMESRVVRMAIDRAEEELGTTGRILVRASGTEPLIRVMVEGSLQTEVERIAHAVALVIKGLPDPS
ncbi:MAG TPA: phosphoglucosamine mutase [Candidatus Baltobacteraceae bacterium]|jgi:phosphoglucosamine mutase|nr:phosphoglucosamine mutase [Candidatus Baltobacteraceae bacterium]